jgi:5'-3' exonuclease
MSKLDLLIEREEKVLFLDAHNAIFRILHITHKQNEMSGTADPTFSYFKFMYLKNILQLIETFKPTKVVVAIDSKQNWRKGVYPDYKANRKVARDASSFDFEAFFPILDEYIEELKALFTNIYFLRIDRCEGDDIIGVLTKEYHDKGIRSIIVSTDRDMNQLLRYKSVKQYDPMKKKMFEILNPLVELECKIIMGDKGDNIPAIKPKVGPVTAAALIKKDYIHEITELNEKVESGLISKTVLSEDQSNSLIHLKNYYRNQQLIDLSFIPKNIKDSINEELNTYTLEKFDSKKLLKFIIKNRMGAFLDELQEMIIVLNSVG